MASPDTIPVKLFGMGKVSSRMLKQKGVTCNPLHLTYRRDSETPDTVDILGEGTIIRLEANVYIEG